MRIKHIPYALVVMLLVAPVPARAIDIDNPPVGVFSDEWYAVMLMGKKSGHMHATMERAKRAGGDAIRTQTDMTLEMGRAGQNISVSVTEKTEESFDGKPLSFSVIQRLGLLPTPSTTTGRIQNGKVFVTASQFGQQSQQTYDLPEGAMMAWAVYREQIKRGLKPGTRYELSAYQPSLAADRLTPITVEVLERETIDLFGRKVDAVKTKQSIKVKGMLGANADVDTITWLTEEGDALRLEMSMMGIPIEIYACPKSVALAKNEPAELINNTLIDIGRPLDRDKARKITYRLAFKKQSSQTQPAGRKLPDLPETDMQKVERKGPGQITLTVTRRSARGPSKGTPLPPKERQGYLAATSSMNYKDSVVAELVTKAAGNEKDPHKLAERFCRFVSDYVKDKNLNVGFATASEVARSKEGDCSEHGVLLAAMGRGVGIPTRIVFGVVYTNALGPGRHVLGGHLWTQYWIDGEWVDLDATLGQVDVDPTHVAFGVSALGDAGFADMVGSLWLTLGSLDISVVSVE